MENLNLNQQNNPEEEINTTPEQVLETQEGDQVDQGIKSKTILMVIVGIIILMLVAWLVINKSLSRFDGVYELEDTSFGEGFDFPEEGVNENVLTNDETEDVQEEHAEEVETPDEPTVSWETNTFFNNVTFQSLVGMNNIWNEGESKKTIPFVEEQFFVQVFGVQNSETKVMFYNVSSGVFIDLLNDVGLENIEEITLDDGTNAYKILDGNQNKETFLLNYGDGVGGGTYLVEIEDNNADNNGLTILNSFSLESPDTANSSENEQEVFNNKPGSVKSIDRVQNGWMVSVDLLTHNQNWIPGDDTSGGFFINQNTKIRNLFLSDNTITYVCGANPQGNLENAANFVSMMESMMSGGSNTEFGFTAYFDIEGVDITSIHQQCLP